MPPLALSTAACLEKTASPFENRSETLKPGPEAGAGDGATATTAATAQDAASADGAAAHVAIARGASTSAGSQAVPVARLAGGHESPGHGVAWEVSTTSSPWARREPSHMHRL